MEANTEINQFNVRVYGLLIHNNHVLLSNEYLRSFAFTKFPGGGLQFGEAPKACLKREFKEELNLDVKPGDLFFTPDFVVNNHFRPEEQVILLYFWVHPENEGDLKDLSLDKKDLESLSETNQVWHQWLAFTDLRPDIMTFPADKAAVEKLLAFSY